MDLLFTLNWKDFTRLETSLSVINTITTGKKPTSLTGRGRGVSSNFTFVRIFRKFLDCLVAICTDLFWNHCFNILLLMFLRIRVNLFKLITWLGLNVHVKKKFSKSLFLGNFWLKAFGECISDYFRWVIFFSIRCFLSSLNLFSILSVTILIIRLAKESANYSWYD